MLKRLFIFSFFLFIKPGQSLGQEDFIKTKEGRPILNRIQLVSNCLKSLQKDKNDKLAVSVCECQTDKIDGHFTYKQFRKYTNNRYIDISELLKEDSLLELEIRKCYTNTGKSILMQAESFKDDFISNCITSIQNNTKKKLDINHITNFCTCQLDLIKTRQISDSLMESFNNPNSLLFYEIMNKCGDPYSNEDPYVENWHKNLARDIIGPSIDTIMILNLHGMTYVEAKVGSMTQFWLFDTGASDLVINKEMEINLKKEGVITEINYLGVGEYEMANGMIDTCRRYKIDNIKIGNFLINNIVVAVSEKGKRIIIGKGLLNKFSNWKLDNTNDTIILTK